MKSVFVAGSRKFYHEIEGFISLLNKKGTKAETAGKFESDEDSAESEKKALLRAFQKIDESNIVYIYSKEGYVGKTVAMEIAYAYSKKKKVIASEKIAEYSAQTLVTEVIAPDEFVNFLKEQEFEQSAKIRKKCWPEFFDAVLSGKKNFDVRIDDFQCAEGDVLLLEEWNPETGEYTGRKIEKRISYVLKTKEQEFWKDADVAEKGFVVIGFKED